MMNYYVLIVTNSMLYLGYRFIIPYYEEVLFRDYFNWDPVLSGYIARVSYKDGPWNRGVSAHH